MSVTPLDHAPLDSSGPAPLGTTEALRRLALGRDGDAWSAVLQRHGPAILRLAQRTTGDGVLCEDICQETLLQIRAHAGRFTPPAAPHEAEAAAKGWVMCIAYRTAVGMLRVRERRCRTEEQAGQLASATINEHDRLLSAEQLALLRSEVARLPELLRSAVCLHFYGEMSYPELCAALNCNEKAARKRVERGVHRLRERLAIAGLALGATALASALGGSAHACGTAAVASAAAAPVSNALNLSRLAEWQALLNHPATPLLSGVAKAGGVAIMTKYIVGAAALLAFALSGVQTFRVNSLSNELSGAREQSESLQGRLSQLEKQFDANRGDVAALRSSLDARNDAVSQLERKVATAETRAQNPQLGYQAFNLPVPAPGTVNKAAFGALPGGAAGDRMYVFTEALDNGNKVTMALPAETPYADLQRAMALDAENRKMRPTQAPPKDLTLKLIDHDTIQYETATGKIVQQFHAKPGTVKDPAAAPAPGATAMPAGAIQNLIDALMTKTAPAAPPPLVPPAMEVPPPVQVAPAQKVSPQPPPPLPPLPGMPARPQPPKPVRPPTPPAENF